MKSLFKRKWLVHLSRMQHRFNWCMGEERNGQFDTPALDVGVKTRGKRRMKLGCDANNDGNKHIGGSVNVIPLAHMWCNARKRMWLQRRTCTSAGKPKGAFCASQSGAIAGVGVHCGRGAKLIGLARLKKGWKFQLAEVYAVYRSTSGHPGVTLLLSPSAARWNENRTRT